MAEDGAVVIPPSPSAEEYADEARRQEAFGADADQGDVFGQDDPLALFGAWMALATKYEINDPNAVALATADGSGMPDVRMVLLKGVEDGFVFYTHHGSSKGEALARNARAAMCFHWKSIRRQVRLRGRVEKVGAGASDAYFAQRSRSSRIGAWASDQSRPLDDPAALRARMDQYAAKFEGQDVPRPEGWGGYVLKPEEIEFWVNRPYRLHERLLFVAEGSGWRTSWLNP